MLAVCRVSGKTYGREDAVNGWLKDLERQPGTPHVTRADSNGMMDALPLTPAQHSGECIISRKHRRQNSQGRQVQLLTLVVTRRWA